MSEPKDNELSWENLGYPSDIRPFPSTMSDWNDGNLPEALEHINKATERAAQFRIDWYDTKATKFGRNARLMRFLALSLAGCGALAPLVKPVLEKLTVPERASSTQLPNGDTSPVLQIAQNQVSWLTELDAIGIVMVAMAGIIVGFDNFFGFSESWMRYRAIQANLIRKLSTFKYEWVVSLSKLPQDPSNVDCTPLIRAQRDFVDGIEEAVQSETSQWSDGLKLRLSMFDKSKGFKSFESALGSVVGKIENWESVKNKPVGVTLDGKEISLDANGTFGASDLTFGIHTLAFNIDGSLTEQTVTVRPGETEMVLVGTAKTRNQ